MITNQNNFVQSPSEKLRQEILKYVYEHEKNNPKPNREKARESNKLHPIFQNIFDSYNRILGGKS